MIAVHAAAAGRVLDVQLAEPEICLQAEGEIEILAGTGYCRACKSEGRNPKTGGKPCGGYINSGYSPYACKNCDHSYDQHD